MKILSLFLLLATFASAAPKPKCEYDTIAEVIRGDGFVKQRDLSFYLARFPELEEHLASLGPRDHIIDMGAGQLFAVYEYLGVEMGILNVDKFPRPAKVTAVSYTVPPERAELAKGREKKFNLLSGRFLNDISLAELTKFGKANLITDFWGVLAYTGNLSEDLQKYVDCLKPGGKIYLAVGPRKFDYRSGTGKGKSKSSVFRSQVRGKDKTLSVPDWLSTIPGLTVVADEAKHNLILTVKDPAKVRIPKLRLLSVKEPITKPPGREFVLVED